MKITDKIVTSLLAFCVLPVAIFFPLIRVLYQINGWEIFQNMVDIPNAVENDTGLTEDSFSIWFVFKNFFSGGLSMSGFDFSNVDDSVKAVLPYLIAAGILFALGVVIGIALFIVNVATKAKKTQCIISAVGIIDLSICGILFSKVAKPIVDGSISVGTLLSSVLGSGGESNFGKVLATSLISIKELNLTSAWSIMILIFAVIIIWNVSYMLTRDEVKGGK
ncbi:MAG: hypothetical protein IIX39_01195 [Clostridia bacterium]|nr:hypothetical protein [Clostridia bacterium]